MDGDGMNVFNVLKKHENEIKEKFHVKRIGLFGSYVRHEENEESDIDILVEFEEPTLHNFMGLIDYLENLFDRKVDLVTQKSLNPYLRPIVEKEVVWCE
ncbi:MULTISPECIES: nucleotidyltransferase family protein [Methanobacterium]|jgi:predicted nucleotidyltransferase|nr:MULTISPECIES: nucleotidyltransferase family protein [Methanobacterium]